MTAWPARRWPESECASRVAGGRLRLSHGPIDLVLDLGGPDAEVRAAESAARDGFEGLLESLVEELTLLRAPITPATPVPRGPVAQSMYCAAFPFAPDFITPMAAVAGAVADHILGAILREAGVTFAVVNNGGDIALHLEGVKTYRLGIHDGRVGGIFAGFVEIAAGDGIGAVATSGSPGPAQSLGFADA